MAEELFNEIYNRLSIEFNSIIMRDDMHEAVYKEIVDRCAMIATAHSPKHEDIGDIIRKTMGLK